MANVLHIKTAVEAGGRIEFVAPELPEGNVVEVFIIDTGQRQPTLKEDIVGWLDTRLPRKTLAEWAQFENDFQAERDSWD